MGTLLRQNVTCATTRGTVEGRCRRRRRYRHLRIDPKCV